MNASSTPKVPSPPANKSAAWAITVLFCGFLLALPIFQAIWEVVVQKRAPLVWDLFTKTPTKANLHGWDKTQQDNSWLAEKVRTPLLQWRWDLFSDPGPKAVLGRDNWLFYAPDVQYLMRPPIGDHRFTQGRLDTSFQGRRVNLSDPTVAILDFQRQLASRGIELLLVPVPGKPSIYPELLDVEAALAISPTLDWIHKLRGQGLHVVDLFTPLRQAKSRGQELYLRQDTHWAPAGLEVAAATIALEARQILTPSRRADSNYMLKDSMVERWGDVAEMTKLERRHQIWPMQRVTAQRVTDRAGRPFAATDTARILWLGDSYSRIFQTDAPGSAGVISHVAFHLQEPLASVVNDGGASTKVRELLQRKRGILAHKKLVIWEFVERDIRFGEGGWTPLQMNPSIFNTTSEAR